MWTTLHFHEKHHDKSIRKDENWEEDAHHPQRPPRLVANLHVNTLGKSNIFLERDRGESKVQGVTQLVDEEHSHSVHDESFLVLTAGNEVSTNVAQQHTDGNLGYGQDEKGPHLVCLTHASETPRLVGRISLPEDALQMSADPSIGFSLLLVQNRTSRPRLRLRRWKHAVAILRNARWRLPEQRGKTHGIPNCIKDGSLKGEHTDALQ